MTSVRDIARAFAWLAPAGGAKNALLRRLGHDVHPTARVRSSVVWHVDRLVVGPGATIGRLNLLRNLTAVTVGEAASIGKFNVITAHPAFRRNPGSGTFVVGHHATVTSRHSFDCSAAVTVGPYSLVAGRGTTVMTHSIDLKLDAQRARPIEVGERSFVGTRSVLVGGAILPPRSVLGAGAVLLPGRGDDAPGLFGGVPARRLSDISGAWFDRPQTHTRRVVLHLDDGQEQVADF